MPSRWELRLLTCLVTFALSCSLTPRAAAQEAPTWTPVPTTATAPATAPAPPPPAPAPEQSRQRPMIGVLVSGTALLAAFYVFNGIASLFAGYTTRSCGTWGLSVCDEFLDSWRPVREYGAIPLIGPWMQIAAKPNSFFDDLWGSWLGLAGLGQAAGLVLLIVGAVVREEVPARASGEQSGERALSLRWTPELGPRSAGLRAELSF